MSRFLAVAGGDEAMLREALVFLYGLPGVPLLYYGTEQGYRGGTGPDWENRESMFAHGWKGNAPDGNSFDRQHPLFRHIAGLNRTRNATRILRDGSCTVEEVDTLRQFIVLRRALASRNAFVLLNASDAPREWSAAERGGFRLWPADAGKLLPGGAVRLHARRSAWLLPEGDR
jgi:glycosidase